MDSIRIFCTCLVVLGVQMVTTVAVAAPGETTIVSLPGPSSSGDSLSDVSSVSGDGRYVAFQSWASNLVVGDTNIRQDVFVVDRETGSVERVSVDSSGQQSNGNSLRPRISGDGRYVAFHSSASNLVLGDTNNALDVFVHDRQTGETSRVSVSSGGGQASGNSLNPGISGDGRYVAFHSFASNLVANDTNLTADMFVHDRQTGETTRVSVGPAGLQGNGSSSTTFPTLSTDGRYVAFTSMASNLVPDDTNNALDVFVHDRQTGETSRVSVSSGGGQADNGGGSSAISADGRYVAFGSSATNLVLGDTNDALDVFVHDRQNVETTRASVSSEGVQGDGLSASPSLSGDGRYVAFTSGASNLVAGDTNTANDVFVHDLLLRTTARVSQTAAGLEGNLGSLGASIAGDGSVVGFTSSATNLDPSSTDGNGQSDVFVQVRATGAVKLLSGVGGAAIGNGDSYSGQRAISADGRYVAFESTASNLVPFDTNSVADIFVRDRQTGQTTRVSVDSAGAQADWSSSGNRPALSGNGRFVAFTSSATNLVFDDRNYAPDVFVHDLQTRETTSVSVDLWRGQSDYGYGSHSPALSDDGRYLAFVSRAYYFITPDANWANDVFLHDRQTGETTRVSVNSAGGQTDYGYGSEGPALSGDGRYVAFYSNAANLVAGDTNNAWDIFVHDRDTGETTRVSVSSAGTQADDNSYSPAISGDGRYVAFHSMARNLVAGDTNSASDVYVHDRQTGQTTRVSVNSAGAQANGYSFLPALSGDGRYLAFESSADNLVAGDTNSTADVFVHDRQTKRTTRVSVDSAGAQADHPSSSPALSGDGGYVTFYSNATNLVAGHADGLWNVFVHERALPPPYTFLGFLSPTDNLPVVNKATAGRTIPIRWRLQLPDGGYASDTTTLVSLLSSPVACDVAPTAIVEEQLASSGSTVFRFDATENMFVYNWQSAGTWRGCRLLQVTIRDLPPQYALFEFR